MAESTEVEERVDFDEDNYMEEMDDDVEEQLDDNREEEGGYRNVKENDEEEEYDDLKNAAAKKDQSAGANKSDIDTDHMEDEEKHIASISEHEKEKHAQLLTLPLDGSEVCISGLPKDATEEDLRDLCEAIGKIFEVRLMKDEDSGESMGFTFVTFKSKEVVKKAIDELHILNVPKSWFEDEFRKVIEDVVGPGVETIELIKDPQNPSRNRGFAFVLYYNNASADYSRQKMTSADFNLEGNTPTVSWADPKSTLDHSAAASQLKYEEIRIS
ncbi:Heterogeneous nuclear ribonucleoprotein like [Melia azedarach]|uniref:Heterogeneous nuclear ribonucleoprotein like n=1 Tax=Melia azedarach TaxID=155640 RepID=A0ACC1YX05_MELAZ|nr:Heterogeneous nuclear ribonucleoprotein like [Melia azedarach]